MGELRHLPVATRVGKTSSVGIGFTTATTGGSRGKSRGIKWPLVILRREGVDLVSPCLGIQLTVLDAAGNAFAIKARANAGASVSLRIHLDVLGLMYSEDCLGCFCRSR